MEIGPDEVPTAIISDPCLGYQRIHCVPVHFNEDKIGDALSKALATFPSQKAEETQGHSSYENDLGASSRRDLFIVLKLASPFYRKEHVKIGLLKTLIDLRLDCLDFHLVHWPQAFRFVDVDPNARGYGGNTQHIDDSNDGANIDPNVSVRETWTAMEELVERGLVKNIVSLLHELTAGSHMMSPAVNQVEMHPHLQQSRLLAYFEKRKIYVQAHSPLCTAGCKEDNEQKLLEDPALQRISKSHGITASQICFVWALQRGMTMVVKSSSLERQPITLSDEEMYEIEGAERGHRYFRPEEWWSHMAMAVFDWN